MNPLARQSLTATILAAALLAFPSLLAAQVAPGYTLNRIDGEATKPAAVARDFIVVLEDKPLIAYDGGLANFKATSAKGQGKAKFDPQVAGKSQYKAMLAQKQDAVVAAMSRAIPQARVIRRLDTVTNAVIVRTDQNTSGRRELEGLPGVKFVFESETRYAHMTESNPLIKAPEAWEIVGGRTTAGQGVRVAVIDSGIEPKHVMFSGRNFDAPTDLPDDDYCFEQPAFCNDKVIVTRYYPPSDIDQLIADEIEEATPRDRDGHGTHVAGTAVGNLIFNSNGQQMSGVAPGAYLMSYKALFADGEGGSSGSDSMLVSALEDAVIDGADVINNSWGSGASIGAYRFYGEIFAQIEAAGVVLATSAGNSGPGSFTVGCPACAEAGLAVASLDSQSRALSVSVVSMAGFDFNAVPGGDIEIPSNVTGAAVIAGNVDAANPAACASFPAGSFSSSIALVFRGANSPEEEGCFFVDKVANVKAAGAIGVIVINNVPGDPITMGGLTDLTFPSVMISLENGQTLINAYSEGVSATIGAISSIDLPVGTISGFSSRGPNIENSVLKPDITAPGSPILSAGLLTAPPNYESFSGTSMASPHVAGAAAILIQHRPDLSAKQYKSILMTSANPEGVFSDSGMSNAGLYARGSGALDVEAALNMPLTFDKPSIGGRCFGVCDITITGTNLGFAPLTLQATLVTDGDGITSSLDNTEYSVGAGETFTITLTTDVTQAATDMLFGNLTLADTFGLIPEVNIPMTVVLSALEDRNIFALNGNIVPNVNSNMSLDISSLGSAEPGSLYDVTILHPDDVTVLPQTAGATTTNATQDAFSADATTGRISWSGRMNEMQGTITASEFFATGLSLVDDFGGGEQGQSFDCGNPEQWSSQGYCDDIKATVGLENFSISIGGVAINTLLIDSNGLLIFNPSEDDVSKHTAGNAPLPYPSAPNSVIAPFWTDLLQGESGIGDIYSGLVFDGSDYWFVVEWYQAREWSQEILPTDPQYTFSVWMKANSDEIHLNYSVIPVVPAYLSIGVEDTSGSSGITRYFDGYGEPPVAGSSLGIDIDTFAGTARIDYQVQVASVAAITPPILATDVNTTLAVDLAGTYNVTDIAAPVMAALDIEGQRYQSSIDLNITHSGTELVISSDPANGTLSQTGGETFSYAPNAEFEGQDSFGYVIRDDQGQDSVEATVLITVGTGGTTDSDGDGLSDDEEIAIGTDPQNADTDGDGLSDAEEIQRGTNPLNEDTDGDGYSDYEEVADGSSPTDANDAPARASNILLLLEALRTHQAKTNPLK